MAFSRFFKPNIGKLRENHDISALAEALDHDDPGIRIAAANALLELNEDGIERLLAWITEGESPSIGTFLKTLASDDPFTDSRILVLFRNAKSETRNLIARDLNGTGVPDENILITTLHDQEKEPKIGAIILLSARGVRMAELIRPLLFDKDPDVALASAQALKTMKWTSENPQDLVRYHYLLGDWKELIKYRQQAIPVLLRAIKDPDPIKRKDGVRTLGKIQNLNAFHEVARLLSDPDASVRAGAVAALSDMGDPRAISMVLPGLRDPTPEVKIEVAWALDHLGWNPRNDTEKIQYLMAREQWSDIIKMGKVAIPPLIESLFTSQSGGKMGIIEALSKMGRPAQEVLTGYANHQNPAIQKTARLALAEMAKKREEEEKHKVTPVDKGVFQKELNESQVAQKNFLAKHGPLKPIPTVSPKPAQAKPAEKSKDTMTLAEIMLKGQVDLSKIPVQNPPPPKNVKSELPGAQYISDINQAISEYHKNTGLTPGVVPAGAGRAEEKLPEVKPEAAKPEPEPEKPAAKPENGEAPIREVKLNPQKPILIEKTREQIIADLIKSLKNSNPVIRVASIEALKIYPKEGRDEIKKLLTDEEARVRETAAEALGEIGDETCVPPLIAMTRDADVEVRIAAIKALGKLQDERAIPHLIHCFTDEYPVIRHVAADALIQIGEEAIITLILYLDDQKPIIRQNAARALGKSKDERVIIPLIKKIGDPDPEMRTAVVQALSMIGIPCIDPLSSVLLRGNREERLGALDALGYITDDRSKALIEHALSDPDEAVRIRAAQVLKKNDALKLWSKVWAEQLHLEKQEEKKKEISFPTKVESAASPAVKNEVSKLIESLRSDDRKTQVSASFKLMVLGKPAVEALLETLKKEDPTLRKNATEILGEMQETAVDPLMNALSDDAPLVRLVAARNLGRIGNMRALDPLIESFVNETDPEVKCTIAESLGYLGDTQAVGPLSHALRDRNLEVQAVSARSLGYIGGEEAVSALISALNDVDEHVRDAALSALRDPLGQVQEHLVAAMRSIDRGIAVGAADALDKISWSSKDPTDSTYFLIAKERWGEIDQYGNAALPPLQALLENPQTEIRIEVIKTIGRIGGSDAIPLLIHALKDENFMVRRRAEQVLGDMGDLARDAILLLPDHDNPEYVRIIQKIDSRKERPSG